LPARRPQHSCKVRRNGASARCLMPPALETSGRAAFPTPTVPQSARPYSPPSVHPPESRVGSAQVHTAVGVVQTRIRRADQPNAASASGPANAKNPACRRGFSRPQRARRQLCQKRASSRMIGSGMPMIQSRKPRPNPMMSPPGVPIKCTAAQKVPNLREMLGTRVRPRCFIHMCVSPGHAFQERNVHEHPRYR
jgi:hypothetical protein